MKKFLFKTAIFLVGVLLLSIVLLAYRLTSENPYSVLFHLKNSQLVTHANTNKVVILGGSNARYGFDSEYLQEKFNRPVINMGITLHQGLAYYLNWSKLYLQEGDWVIISPEYRTTDSEGGLYGSYMLVDVAPDNTHFKQYLLSDYKVIKNQLLQSHMIISQSVNSLINPDTKKEILLASHNAAGDAIGNHGKSKNYAANMVIIQKPFGDYFAVMKEFAAYCKSKHIKVFLSFPPASKDLVDVKENLQQIVALHKQELPEVIILNSPQDAFYPDNLFYDSSYHLNSAGKKIHTQHVYTRLENHHMSSSDAIASMYTINK